MSDEQTNATLFGLADPLPAEGKTFGYVKIPYSSDLSAYGFIGLPIVVVGNGEGPTVLLMAGSQGDEYEGQVALSRLARELDHTKLKGRVIILPMANAPAARAGFRNSPIDGLNLNRIYPGDVRGRPTSMIASYIERHLMAEADIVLDLHSGGRSLRYQPCATIIDHVDPAERARRLALATAFGAPFVLISKGFEERNSSGAAMRAGAVRMGAEIGGGESLERNLVDLTYSGILRVLAWTGILEASQASSHETAPAPVREVVQLRDYVYSVSKGLFEAAVEFEDVVNAGDLAGLIHDPLRPLEPPVEVRFKSSGTVICKRAPGPTDLGDCLVHLAQEYQEQMPGELEQARTSHWLKEQFRNRKPKVKRAKKHKELP